MAWPRRSSGPKVTRECEEAREEAREEAVREAAASEAEAREEVREAVRVEAREDGGPPLAHDEPCTFPGVLLLLLGVSTALPPLAAASALLRSASSIRIMLTAREPPERLEPAEGVLAAPGVAAEEGPSEENEPWEDAEDTETGETEEACVSDGA